MASRRHVMFGLHERSHQEKKKTNPPNIPVFPRPHGPTSHFIRRTLLVLTSLIKGVMHVCACVCARSLLHGWKGCALRPPGVDAVPVAVLTSTRHSTKPPPSFPVPSSSNAPRRPALTSRCHVIGRFAICAGKHLYTLPTRRPVCKFSRSHCHSD